MVAISEKLITSRIETLQVLTLRDHLINYFIFFETDEEVKTETPTTERDMNVTEIGLSKKIQ